MPQREAKIYWITRTNEKDLLVFDAGHEDGTLYIYELKESVLVQDTQKMAKNVESWIEKKYGFPKMEWKIEPL